MEDLGDAGNGILRPTINKLPLSPWRHEHDNNTVCGDQQRPVAAQCKARSNLNWQNRNSVFCDKSETFMKHFCNSAVWPWQEFVLFCNSPGVPSPVGKRSKGFCFVASSRNWIPLSTQCGQHRNKTRIVDVSLWRCAGVLSYVWAFCVILCCANGVRFNSKME